MRAAAVGTLLLLALAVSTSARRNSKRMLIEKAPSPAEYKDARSGRARQGRQIQPLACVSKSGGEKGVCMFAWNCVEAGGQHLGTCIDRFYFGSCCKLGAKKEGAVSSDTGATAEATGAGDITENEIPDENLSIVKDPSTTKPSTTSTASILSTASTSISTVATTTTATTSTTTVTTTSTTNAPTTHTTTTSTTSTSTTNTPSSTATTTTTTTTTTTATSTTSTTTSTTSTSTTTTTTAATSTTSSTTTTATSTTSTTSTITSTSDTVTEETMEITELPAAETTDSESTQDPKEESTSTITSTSDTVTEETTEITELPAAETTDSESTEDPKEESTTSQESSTPKEDQDTTELEGVLGNQSLEGDFLVPEEDVFIPVDVIIDPDEDEEEDFSVDIDVEEATPEPSSTEAAVQTTEVSREETETTTIAEVIIEIGTESATTAEDQTTTETIEVDVVIQENEELEGDSFQGSPVDPSDEGAPNTDSWNNPAVSGSTETVTTPAQAPFVEPVVVEEDEDCRDKWVAVKVGLDGNPSAVEGLGGCPAKPGMQFNCSETVISEGIYNCTVVGGSTPDSEKPESEKPQLEEQKPEVEIPVDADGCKDTWVAVHIGPDGSPNAVGGLGGCEARPGQYFNCSDTVIAEGIYNCTVVDGPKPGPTAGGDSGVICNDASKIQECITGDKSTTTTTTTTTTSPTPDIEANIIEVEVEDVEEEEEEDGSDLWTKGLNRSYREVCGRTPWLDKTFRSQYAAPRNGRMIGGQRTEKEAGGLWGQHNRRGKIVNGQDAKYGEWPWQVSLRQWRTATFLHKCGAALLSENWAITAAHCVESVNPDELLLRMGEFDLNDEEDEPYTFQDRKVQIVASHPKFDPKTFEYDLALLRFYDPVVFTPNVIPVCIPENDQDLVGKEAWVTGWGRLYEDGPLPSKMQKVTLPIINNTECERMYETAGFREHIPHIFICAGYREGGKDSCEGDSGGPMSVRRDDGRYMLSGVISWGIGCAEKNQPGVYTRISDFKDWINQILQY